MQLTLLISFFSAATLLPSLAAPVPAADTEQDILERHDFYDFIDIEARGKVTAAEVVHWFSDAANAHTLTGNICFWSGRTTGAPGKGGISVIWRAETKVADFGKDALVGCKTIYDVFDEAGKAGAKGFDKHLNFDAKGWEDVSVALAAHMHGTAKALLGDNLPQASVWDKELKALKANKNVVGIEHYALTNTGGWMKQKNIK